MSLTLRPFEVERDAETVASLFTWNDAFTWNASDVVANNRRWPKSKPMFRVIAEVGDEPVGYGRACEITKNPRGAFQGELIVYPQHHRKGYGRALLEQIEDFAKRGGAKCFIFMVYERWPYAMEAAERLGYSRRTLYYQSTIDPRGFELAPFAPKIERLENEGYVVQPLSRIENSDEADRAYFEAVHSSDKDTPFMDYFGWPTFEDFKQMTLSAPWFDRDGVFVAMHGSKIVGVSTVNRGSLEFNGEMFIDYTGVVKEHRGKGLATAMKAKALAYAKTIGGTMVRTENNDANPSMRAVNKKLGFVEKPGMWMVVKDL